MAFVQAKWFRDENRGAGDIHRLVAHSAEIQEHRDSAEDVANFFATTAKKVSAHACGDNTSIVTCVRDEDVAFHALGDNHHTLGFEFSGFAGQTRAQWRDRYSIDMLELAAPWWADKAAKNGIPVRWLTAEQEARRAKGFVTHKIVSDVHGEGTRSDPGPHFPYDEFLEMVRAHMPPPSARRKFQLTTGEGAKLAVSIGVAPDRAAQRERLAKFLSGVRVDAILDAMDADAELGDPEDVRIRRVEA